MTVHASAAVTWYSNQCRTRQGTQHNITDNQISYVHETTDTTVILPTECLHVKQQTIITAACCPSDIKTKDVAHRLKFIFVKQMIKLGLKIEWGALMDFIFYKLTIIILPTS